MHKLIDVACRRTAGMAAGVILIGGVAGGVLLTPGTALAAATTVNTTTAITSTTQTSTQTGTTLDIQVSVTPASGTVAPSGDVTVSDGSGGCNITLAQNGFGGTGAGSCDMPNLPDGTYTLTATYQGSPLFGSSASGPDTVYIEHGGGGRADIRTYLNCTPRVFTGQRGSCTLWVTNAGFSPSPDVTAQIALPYQLRADYCGYYWSFGCSISGNTAQQDLGTLRPGQTAQLTVVFTARTGFNLFGRHPGHAFTVRVVGSASWYGYLWFFGPQASYSTAYVTIIPQGFWW